MTIRKSFLVLVFLAAIMAVMLLACNKPCLAVTFVKDAPVDYEDPRNEDFLIKSYVQQAQQPFKEPGRAPEPTTFVLFLGGVAGVCVRFVRNSFSKFKRYMDLFLSTSGLLICAPILIFVALLIKFNSKGSIIYKQERVGKRGRIFSIYKLRTMRVDAEHQTGAVWAKKNDPRVTSVGRILRKTHIDEIPQLFNVIRGEMSIVGPRPERPEMVRDLMKLILDYERRFQVKPGITGLAQIWHKYDETIEDVKKKIKYDVLYVKKMCLSADLKILAKTAVVVVTGKGTN